MSVFLLDEELWLPDPYLGDEDGLVAVGGAIVQSTPAQFELPFPAILAITSFTLRVSLRLQVLDAPSKCSVSWDFLPRLIFFHFYPCFSAINNVKK
jgi:hypothetical protein